MAEIPQVLLNNGIKMPQLGLGVWQTKEGDELITAVQAATQAGYRLIDTAAVYGNERGVGDGVRASGVPREELFITTKLWNSDQGYDNALKAFEASLGRLGMDYVDLYLIHWPVPAQDKYVETWRALETIYESGRAKAIGVCNFQVEHLQNLLASAKVPPAINQVELHPRLPQREVREFCAKHDIQVESWGPIGGSGGDLLQNPTIQLIADKHHRSPAQIVLRWHVQQGLIVIPKSVHVERIQQNAAVFDFELDNDDMAKLSALNTGNRHGPDPATMNGH